MHRRQRANCRRRHPRSKPWRHGTIGALRLDHAWGMAARSGEGADMPASGNRESQRAELHKAIWGIADEVRGAVDLVVQLPANLFFGVTIATCVIVLSKHKTDGIVKRQTELREQIDAIVADLEA
ncbi:N-6 DNA methylase [Bifidobacterium simiarum]|nr:N-6 DNA methylase [Bifidobacterium simiarum]